MNENTGVINPPHDTGPEHCPACQKLVREGKEELCQWCKGTISPYFDHFGGAHDFLSAISFRESIRDGKSAFMRSRGKDRCGVLWHRTRAEKALKNADISKADLPEIIYHACTIVHGCEHDLQLHLQGKAKL